MDNLTGPKYSFRNPFVKIHYKENPATNDFHLQIVSHHYRDRENELTIFAKKLN